MTAEEIKVYLAEQFHLSIGQIEQMLPAFIDALDTHLKDLDTALVSCNLKTIGKAGHKIKGACLNLGLVECAQIALIIEEKGKAGDADTDFQKLAHDLHSKIDPLLC